MTILTAPVVWRRTRHALPHAGKLTAKQAANTQTALRWLALRHGSMKALVKLLGCSRSAMYNSTPRLAVAVANVAGVGVDAILFGMWPGDRCPHCGGTGRQLQVVT